MLTNLGCLPLDKIHAMLKIFVQDTVECSLDELRYFLEKKVRQHELLLSNDVYRLPRP